MTGTVKALVLVYLVSYLFYVLTPNVRDFVDLHVALGPQLFMDELWQPLTSLLAPVHFFSFLFPFVGLWYVGGVIEQQRGRGRFLALFFGAGALANFAIAGVWRLRPHGPIPIDDGCGFAVIALAVAFARIYSRQPVMFWPTTLMVQARWLILIMIGLGAASFSARADWHLLAGLAVAVVAGYFGAGSGGFSELRGFLSSAREAAAARRTRRRFGVIEGGARPKKKYMN